MSDPRLDVYLLGETQLSTSPAKLALNLAAIFKKDISVFEKMLSQPRSLLKANVDTETANKYKKAIDKAGGCCELVRRDQPVSPIQAVPVSEPSSLSENILPEIPRSALTLAPVVNTPLTISVDDDIDNEARASLTRAYSSHNLDDAEHDAPFAATSEGSTNFPTRFGKKGIIFGVCILVVGVLAAVALPAYLNHAARTILSGASPLINDTRQKITQVIQQKNFLPSENILAGLPETINNEFVSSIQLKEGAQMVVAFRIALLGDSNTIIWTPTKKGDEVVWHCRDGTMSDKYRMPECRGGSGAN